MKALIFNSGLGKRMGTLTEHQPKCLIALNENDTILSRQLKVLYQAGITEVVMTTGPHSRLLMEYCRSLCLSMQFTFVFNPFYRQTNYIYSLYLALKHLNDSFLMLHGDLVFDPTIVLGMVESRQSLMAVSTTQPLPDKDFKAVIKNGQIIKIGVEYFEGAVAAQPLYKLNSDDWRAWQDEVVLFCEQGRVACYAEEAFNEVSERCLIYPYDFKDRLCAEIDNEKDLTAVREILGLNI